MIFNEKFMFRKMLLFIRSFVNVLLFIRGANLLRSIETVYNESTKFDYGQFGFQMDEQHESKVYDVIKLCKFGSFGDGGSENATGAGNHCVTFSIVFIKKLTIKDGETPIEFEQRKYFEFNSTSKIFNEIKDTFRANLSENAKILPFVPTNFEELPNIYFFTIPFTFNYNCTDNIIDEIKRLFQEIRGLIEEKSINDLNLMIIVNTADEDLDSTLYYHHYKSYFISVKSCLLFIVNSSDTYEIITILENKYLSSSPNNSEEGFIGYMGNMPTNLAFLNGDSEEEKGYENVRFSFTILQPPTNE